MNYSMNQLYQVVGISKQAVYQHEKRQSCFDNRAACLIEEAQDLRKVHPGCGVEKMYHVLQPDFIGRDRFVELMMDAGFRLTKKKNYRRTTYSSSLHYSNLIKGIKVNAPSLLWQSDITYFEMNGKFYYLTFIIDVYTKKIVGYEASHHMRATANQKALRQALHTHKPPLIHHSDRGSQYVCKEYISLLKQNNIGISMALSAQDNAYAERINRTIKEEYLDYWKPVSIEQLKRQIKKAVNHYNNERPHNNLQKLTPVDFETRWYQGKLNQIPSITIFDNETNK